MNVSWKTAYSIAMSDSVDLRKLLKGWTYDPENDARLLRGDDGREILQVRTILGIEQYEMDGRPDGSRPHGMESAFDLYCEQCELAKAAELAPERIDIAIWRHVCRARGHKARGRHDEALASYRKVLELDPQHREARELIEPLDRRERRRGGLVSKWLGKVSR